MKHYVKVSDQDSDCFEYLEDKFPKIDYSKLKECIFDNPQIRFMFNNETFITKMNDDEKPAWLSFKKVSENFLGIRKVQIPRIQLGNVGNLIGWAVDEVEIAFPSLASGLLSRDYSDEWFHQDITEMKHRYRGRWDVNIMAT